MGTNVRFSPDGRSLTYGTLRSTANLWLMDGLKSVTVRPAPNEITSATGAGGMVRCFASSRS